MKLSHTNQNRKGVVSKSTALFYFFFSITALLSLGFISCEDNISRPEEHEDYTTTLTGKVILENQVEHSNALIYIESLDIGVSSDSSGLFKFQFTDDNNIYNGIFTVYYFLEDYDMDSARIMLTSGKVKLDTLDVDSKGNLPQVEMKQILQVEGWTDKQEYRIGDTLVFTVRWTNVSGRILPLRMWYVSGKCGGPYGLPGMVIYRDSNYPSYSFQSLSGSEDENTLFLSPGDFYEGCDWDCVPEGTYTYRWINSTLVDTFWVLKPVEYIVVSSNFEIKDRGYSVPESLSDSLLFTWDGLQGGESPRCDMTPNKFNFPHIQIIK